MIHTIFYPLFCFQSISEIRQEDQGIFLDLILDMNRKFYTMESVEWKNLIILSFGKTVDNQDKLLTECKRCAAKPFSLFVKLKELNI